MWDRKIRQIEMHPLSTSYFSVPHFSVYFCFLFFCLTFFCLLLLLIFNLFTDRLEKHCVFGDIYPLNNFKAGMFKQPASMFLKQAGVIGQGRYFEGNTRRHETELL